MRHAFGYSVLFHAVVFMIGYMGLPYFKRLPALTAAPIMVEIVNVDEVTNAPPPAPKPVKKPEPKVKKEPPPPPKAPPAALHSCSVPAAVRARSRGRDHSSAV